MDIRILAVQRFENPLQSNPRTKRMEKDRGEPPSLIVAGERGTDRILVPILRRAHRRLQDSPSHLPWNAGVSIELTLRLLDPMERRSRNWKIISVLKTLRIRLLEDRSQGDRCLAANLLGLVDALQNGHQRVSQLVVDDREAACKLCCGQEFGLGCSVIAKNLEQLLPSP
jgi:hypothetical protein